MNNISRNLQTVLTAVHTVSLKTELSNSERHHSYSLFQYLVSLFSRYGAASSSPFTLVQYSCSYTVFTFMILNAV